MRTRSSRRLAIGLGAVLLLSACGGSSGTESTPTADEAVTATTPAAESDPAAAEAPADDAATVSTPDNVWTDPETEPPADAVPADEAPTDEAPTEEAPAEEAPVEEAPVVTEAAVAEAQIGGRDLGAALAPAASFAGNPLPDLIVDDVGREIEVNIANVLPSDRPVLLWTWAPH